MKSVYTTGEAAKVCGLSLSTIKRWIKKGAICSYRTPGGDIRIPYVQLCDFMREYDIPLQQLETDEQKVLLSVDEPGLRKSLVKELHTIQPAVQIEVAESSMVLGFSLSSFRPSVVILGKGGKGEEISSRCHHIRKCMAPDVVQIGICLPLGTISESRAGADSVLNASSEGSEIGNFIASLVQPRIVTRLMSRQTA